MENFLDILVIEVQEVEISNVIDPEGEYEVEVIDPMEYMFDNLMKKIDSNPANRGQAVALLQPAPPASGVCTLAASSASAGTVAALHPETVSQASQHVATVELSGQQTRGMMILDKRPAQVTEGQRKNVTIIEKIDRAKLQQCLTNAFSLTSDNVS